MAGIFERFRPHRARQGAGHVRRQESGQKHGPAPVTLWNLPRSDIGSLNKKRRRKAPFIHVSCLSSVVREMRLVVVPPIPAMMMVWPVVTPAVVAIPTMVRLVMLNDHRAMMMPAMIILSLSISCGQSDNAQRDERCCQNFHFYSPWVPNEIGGLIVSVRPD